jgi:hypothetical protein
MAKYLITGYLVTPYSVTVDADSEDEAEIQGADLIENDSPECYAGEPAFQPEFDVEEVEE